MNQRQKAAAVGIGLLGVAALAALPAWAESADFHTNPLLTAADHAAATVCHRLPGHTFEIAGRPLPLCARCSGIWLGTALVLALTAGAGRGRSLLFPGRPGVLALGALVGVMGLDGINALLFDTGGPFLYPPHNTVRLFTGLGAGLAVGLLLVPAFAWSAWREGEYRPILRRPREWIALFALAIVLALVLLSNQPPLLYVLALVSTATIPLVLTLLYTILVLLALRRESCAATWRDLWSVLVAGALLATAQMALLAWIRHAVTGAWL
jgi:uncharacterized membrane protein